MIELEALQQALRLIRSLGGELVAVSPQTVRRNDSLRRQKALTFPVLSDPGNQVAAAYGLRHTLSDRLREVYEDVFKVRLPLYNGDESWTLPMPARFVIDRGGAIRYAAVSADYTRRPEMADTLDVLRGLRP